MTNTHIYEASDYAGIEAGDYKFYYGYERVFCPTHHVMDVQDSPNCEYDNNSENDCDGNTEWCFVAFSKEKIVAWYSTSDLESLVKEGEGTAHYLLAGIAKMLEDKKLVYGISNV